MLLATLFLLVLLLAGSSLAPDSIVPPGDSPLTDVVFIWPSNMTTSLPWYPVQPWEVEVCSRGLSTMYASDEETNDIFDFNLQEPIYMDTVALIALKQPGAQGTTLYEIGWYLQPYDGTYDATLTLYETSGKNHTLKAGQGTTGAAFEGYEAFPIPCDPKVYRCPNVKGTIDSVKLEWREVINQTKGPVQYVRSRFVLVNESENETGV